MTGSLAQIFDRYTFDNNLVDVDIGDDYAGQAPAGLGVQHAQELRAEFDVAQINCDQVRLLFAIDGLVDHFARSSVVGLVTDSVLLGCLDCLGDALGFEGQLGLEYLGEVGFEIVLGLRMLNPCAPQLVGHKQQHNNSGANEPATDRA